ncbi:MAG: hypothetical protein Q4D81_01030 [Eubacteriales bacterium]|nr:hypothetical protein [Eubacteriales bacterium]
MMGLKEKMYPELMSEKQLAEAFRELEERVGREMSETLRDQKKRVEILETLLESDHTQYRCAILLMLYRKAEKLGPEIRLFALPYLIDLLADDKGTVRNCARECAGRIIALEFEQDPSVWSDSLRKILFVGRGRGGMDAARVRMGNALKGLLDTVCGNVPENCRKAVISTYCNYFKSTKWDSISCVSLLKGIFDMPYKVWGTMQRGNILGFVRYFLKNDTGEIRLAALILLYRWLQEGWKPSRDFADYLVNMLEVVSGEKTESNTEEKGAPALQYLSWKICGILRGESCESAGRGVMDFEDTVLYRENLDSSVPVLIKKINLQMLREKYIENLSAGGSAAESPSPEAPARDVPGVEVSAPENTARKDPAPEVPAGEDAAGKRGGGRTDGGSPDSAFSGYGSHLMVFMRLDQEEALFRKAGDDLLEIMDDLGEHQKREIMIELFKCVELEEDSSHYLPFLIGQCWLHIPTSMQKDLVPKMQRLRNSENAETVEIVMAAACEILGHLSKGDSGDTLPKDRELRQNIRQSMSGMLCQGLYSDRRIVAENTAFTVGYDLFRTLDGTCLPDTGTESGADGIREPVVSIARSVLLYMQAAEKPDPLYRYLTVHEIARYLTEIGQSYADPKRPVAFFAGSFDPFSNSHRAVAKEIAEMGFQVYIGVDDFSWDRNTQPLAVRRKIVLLSIADLAHVRIFPQELVINPENAGDLQRLCSLFPGQKVYLVCGSDRVENGRVYRQAPSVGSVRSFPHIVFMRNEPSLDSSSGNELFGENRYGKDRRQEDYRRGGSGKGDFRGGVRSGNGRDDDDSGDFRSETIGHAEDLSEYLTGEVIYLKLPIYYEHMTSLQIRYNLQEGRSIDDLVTVPVRQYIRRRNLYAAERIYKREIETKRIETRVESAEGQLRVTLIDEYSGETLGELVARACGEQEDPDAGRNGNRSANPGTNRNPQACKRPFRDLEIISLSWLEDADSTQPGMLLDEALLVFQAQGFEVVYAAGHLCDKILFKERGFIRLSGEGDRFCVDLRAPIALIGDAASCVPEIFSDEPSLRKVLQENERDLRLGMAGLYPGNAVLFLNINILNDRIARRISERSGNTDWICVPFGKTMKDLQIPGTVTMALHTERVYAPDLQTYDIREVNGYPDLSVQISHLKSMDRPFLLAEYCFHNGYLLPKIAQALEEQSLREEGMIVGVTSDHGRAIAREDGREVEAVYDIPNMKTRIMESEMIPFYRGNRILWSLAGQRTEEDSRNSRNERLPSTYPLLPYQMPSTLQDAPFQAVYDLSRICLENARRLFSTLETIYENRYFRRLTLERLGEVIEDPGCPETAALSPLSRKQAVSELLTQDIDRLMRFHPGRG